MNISLDYILLADNLRITDAIVDTILTNSRANIVSLGKVNISGSEVKWEVTNCQNIIVHPQTEVDVCQPPSGTLVSQKPTMEVNLSPLSMSLVSVIRYLKWSSVLFLYDKSTGTCTKLM